LRYLTTTRMPGSQARQNVMPAILGRRTS
jgi:hypothetical protein